jgi:hypothetical protein
MPAHLAQHLQAGHSSPGVFVIRLGYSIAQLVDHLELVGYAGKSTDYENAVTYIP